MKNVIKKIVAITLCVVMILGIAPLSGFVGLELPKLNIHLPKISEIFTTKASAATSTASGTCGTSLTWNLANGTLIISGTGAMKDYDSTAEVPWYSSRASIKKAIIKDGVTSIGEHSFHGCTSLTSVTIPDSVTSIGNYVFCGCTGLTSITIPDSVAIIGGGAFEDCTSLISVVISDGVTSIGYDAFRDCTSLTSITIPDTITRIYSHAFYNTGFYSDSNNWTNGVLYIGHHLIEAKTSISGAYSIKNGTICIADRAFYECTKLTEINIPNTIVTIGIYSFGHCINIKDLVIPGSVTIIGNMAFIECTGIINVTFSSSGLVTIENEVFNGCTRLESIMIPNSVNSIGVDAFEDCASLKHIYYGGKPVEWRRISIDSSNTVLRNAKDYIYYDNNSSDVWIHYSKDYTVQFYVMGEEYIIESYDEGEKIVTPPCKNLNNYTFVEWENVPTTMPAHDLEICGKYLPNIYNITFDSNGGSDAPSSQNETYGIPIQLSTSVPKRTGYTFLGWSTNKSATTATYKPGGEYTAEGDATLYAVWSVNSYTISFNTFGGTTKSSITKTYGSSVTAPSNPTRSGYTFVGWDQAVPSTMPAQNIQINALWKPSSHTHATTLINTKLPTCTEDGFSGYTFCETCNKVVDNGYVLPAYGHDYESNVAVEQTCTATGKVTYTCTLCGDSYNVTTEATGHSRTKEEITTAPTCIEEGVKTITCHCGYHWTEAVAATGHSCTYEIIKVPSCTEEGVMEYTCKVCGYVYTDAISKTDHQYKPVVTSPTCTEKGYTTHTCSVCGDTYVDTYTNALGHKSAKKDYIAPTCTAEGYSAATYCSVCNVVLSEATVIPALGHDYSKQVTITESTCTVNGSYALQCSRCTEYEKDGNGAKKTYVKDLKAHSYVSTITTPATAITDGLMTYKCSVCGYSYTAVIPATNEPFTITFNAGLGKFADGTSVKTKKFTYKSAVTEVSETPSRLGYRFTGWAALPSTMPAADITVNAQWEVIGSRFGTDNRYKFSNSNLNFVTTWSDRSYYMTSSDMTKLINYVSMYEAYPEWTISNIQAARNSKWSGSCFGMSSTAILDYQNRIAFNENFDSGASSMRAVKSPASSKTIMSAINYYQVAQRIRFIRNSAYYYDKDYSGWSTGLKKLVDTANIGDPFLFCYYFSQGGHAIVATGVEMDTKGNYNISAYDNRYPNNDVTIYVDKDFSQCIVKTPDANEVAFKIEFYDSMSVFDKIDIDGPNNDMVIDYNAYSDSNSNTFIEVLADGDVTVTDASGKTITIKDGTVSGSMNILSTRMIVNSTDEGGVAPATFVFEVNNSDRYTFKSTSDTMSASIQSPTMYAGANTENADSIVIGNNDGVYVNGSDVEYNASLSSQTSDYNTVTVTGTAQNNASVKYDSNGDIVANGVNGNTDTVSVYSDGTNVSDYNFQAGYSSIMITTNSAGTGFDILASNTNFADVSIRNYVTSRTVDYKTTMTFHYDAELPKGASVHWYYNGQDKGTSESYTVSQATGDFTIQAKIIGSDGKSVLAESKVEAIKVNHGFFDKLIAFFKGLFGSLPKIDQ